MSKLIRTYVQDARELGPNTKMRGARHWTAVQILSPMWFEVVSCLQGSGHIDEWVAPSISQAIEISKSLGPTRWTRIFIRMRTSKSILDAIVHEEIDKAYVVLESGGHVLKLTNGFSYTIEAEEDAGDKSSDIKEMRLIYSRSSNR